MRFSQDTKKQARLRQKGRCGVCGEKLREYHWEEAHHIYPDSLGGRDHVDNCVILCKDCHNRVHYDGRFQTRIVAPKSYFEYFYGRIMK